MLSVDKALRDLVAIEIVSVMDEWDQCVTLVTSVDITLYIVSGLWI